MKRDIFKKLMYKKWFIQKIVGSIIIFMSIIIIIIIVQMNERTVLINEGTTKSVPMLSADTIAKLGEIYIMKENEFDFFRLWDSSFYGKGGMHGQMAMSDGRVSAAWHAYAENSEQIERDFIEALT